MAQVLSPSKYPNLGDCETPVLESPVFINCPLPLPDLDVSNRANRIMGRAILNRWQIESRNLKPILNVKIVKP